MKEKEILNHLESWHKTLEETNVDVLGPSLQTLAEDDQDHHDIICVGDQDHIHLEDIDDPSLEIEVENDDSGLTLKHMEKLCLVQIQKQPFARED